MGTHPREHLRTALAAVQWEPVLGTGGAELLSCWAAPLLPQLPEPGPGSPAPAALRRAVAPPRGGGTGRGGTGATGKG